jgi:PDZ domain-containing protein
MDPSTSEPTPDVGAGPVTRRPGRRRVHRVVAASAVVLVGAAGSVTWHIPSGRDAEQPGPVLDLATRVQVQDPAATKIHGAFDGLTVRIEPLTYGDEIIHAVTGDPATIVPDREVRPPDVPASTYHAIQKSAYVDGGQVAAAVAEKALGRKVTVTNDGLDIVHVEDASPAATALRAGDRITAVDGASVSSTGALSAAIQAAGGKAVTVTIVPTGATGQREVTVTPVHSDDRLVIGVIVDPSNLDVQLEVPVKIDARGVEGPSAGLMTALTVYDQLSSTDLAAGRTIAGTGTIDIDGNVGEIGGIKAKARAAAAAGAQLFLAPASQAADARAVLGDKIPVIGVTTFQQALDALRTDATTTPAVSAA